MNEKALSYRHNLHLNAFANANMSAIPPIVGVKTEFGGR